MSMQCYRHPKVETGVSCGKCDRPICTRCMIPGPAGMRCPDCASLRGSTLYKVHPARLALAIIAGLVTGVIGAMILTAVSFFVFFIGPIYGTIVAEAVLRASGQKRGRLLETIGIGSIVIGGLVVFSRILLPMIGMANAVSQGGGPGAAPPLGFVLSYSLMGMVWPLIGIGLAISACFYRMRHL